MDNPGQPTMYAAAAMSSVVPTKSFYSFRDLSNTEYALRKDLDDGYHHIQIKCTGFMDFSYTMSARVFQSFAPAAFSQAFVVPATETQGGQQPPYYVLVLRPCIVDVQALVHILEWMISVCHVKLPYILPMPNNFFAWIELLKAALALQVHIAEARVWSFVARFITDGPLEWGHLDAVMSNFLPDSKIVKHLLHNIQYNKVRRRLTRSALTYISLNEPFAALLREIEYTHRMNKAQKASRRVRNNEVFNATDFFA